MNKDEIKVGTIRLIPKGTQIWSINNQTNFITVNDEICEIEKTVFNSDYIYVEPMQYVSYTNSIMTKGDDNWGLSYSNTKEYIKPEPFIYFIINHYDNRGKIK